MAQDSKSRHFRIALALGLIYDPAFGPIRA